MEGCVIVGPDFLLKWGTAIRRFMMEMANNIEMGLRSTL
jgi:hypothetical protein